MASFTLEIAEGLNFPNITVYKKMWDDVQNGWRFVSNDGYVMYDPNADNTELDTYTMERVPVVYYYCNVDCPSTYNWDNFAWLAVPRSSVDENYVF